MRGFSLTKLAVSLAVLGVTGLAGLFGYQLLRADVAAEVYRDRLEGLAADYDQLRGQFNEVVAQTAVTELLVEDGQIDIRLRTAAGELARLDTPFTADAEIHLDYVIVDGRLLIRRIYDEHTPPVEAMFVDRALTQIDWDAPGTRHGTTVYRAVDEGRWVVSVSANGSLDLNRAGPADQIELVAGPPIREYDQIEADARAEIGGIGPAEVFRRLLHGSGSNADARPADSSADSPIDATPGG
ncbi:MAG: hypothetical protein AAGF47_00860 [Planctomycetota bacterium]